MIPATMTHRQRVRMAHAVSSLEITISVSLMVVLTALGLDLGLIMLGMSLNDAACRDAVRAAAQQSTKQNAIKAAKTQLQVHDTDGFWVSQPVLTSIDAPYFVYQDFGGNPPVNTSPYVTVTTSVSIRCPAPIFFFGTHFANNGMLQFDRRYTFPIIRVTFYG